MERKKEVYVESLGTKKEEDDFGSMVESVIVGRVVYLMGGTNWMTGQQFPRGYFLSVGPETRGDGFVSTILGSGYKALIKPAARFSQKELDALEPDPEQLARMVNRIKNEAAQKRAA